MCKQWPICTSTWPTCTSNKLRVLASSMHSSMLCCVKVYLETVPMPSMEVYSGKPQDKDKVVHFEDWMQTTYRGLTAELGKLDWPFLSKEDKADMFLGQLDKYFKKREKLLGGDESYLFPRDRPSPAALQVSLLLAYCIAACKHHMH